MFRVEEGPSHSQLKQVNLVMNGNPEKCFALEFKHKLQLVDIQKAAEARWGSKYGKAMRLFSPEGVEYEAEDLRYVRASDNIYVSKGTTADTQARTSTLIAALDSMKLYALSARVASARCR